MPQPPAPCRHPPEGGVPILLVGETVPPRPTDTTTPKANVPTVDLIASACVRQAQGLPIPGRLALNGTPIRSPKFSKDDGLLGVSTETLNRRRRRAGRCRSRGTPPWVVFLASIFREDPFMADSFRGSWAGTRYSIAIPCVALTLAWAYWAMMVAS